MEIIKITKRETHLMHRAKDIFGILGLKYSLSTQIDTKTQVAFENN